MRVERVLTCECGFDARAADEEGLVAAVRRRADYLEPELQALSGIRTQGLLLTMKVRGRKPRVWRKVGALRVAKRSARY